MKLLFGIKALDVAGGGAERVLATVSSGLVKRGHDVAVLSFDPPGGDSFYALDERVRRTCLGLGPTEAPTGISVFFRRLPALRRVLGIEQPDVAIGFMHSMFVPMSFAAASLDIPMVASEHIVPHHYESKRFQYILFVAGCLLSARVTVLSEEIRLMYPRLLQNRMTPMPNPVENYSGNPEIPGGENESEKIILSVGRLEHQKDHATLIKAFASVSGRFPDWKLRIIGEGSLRDSLKNLVRGLNLEERVELPGASAQMDKEYAAARVVAVPSRYESFGLATAEAMSAGLPVIGFEDCPGTRELIRHGSNGWLVAGGLDDTRSGSMAAGLEMLLADGPLRNRLGAAGPETVRPYVPESVVDRWETLLSQTV